MRAPALIMAAVAGLGACAAPVGSGQAVPAGPPAQMPGVPPVDAGPSPCDVSIWLHGGFGGIEGRFTANQNMLNAWWDRSVSAVEVTAGTWQFYSERDFRGDMVAAGPGRYDNLGKSWNDRIRSFRCIRMGGPISADPFGDADREDEASTLPAE